MKSFRVHLKEEKEIYGKWSTASMTFQNYYIPLSKKMIERLFPKKPKKVTAFHITDLPNMLKLVKLQGGAKGLSTLTYLHPEKRNLLLKGIESAGGALAELEGFPLIHANVDAYTHVDDQGRRWIGFSRIQTPESIKSGYKPAKGMDIMRHRVFQKFVNKFPQGTPEFGTLTEFRDFFRFTGAANASSIFPWGADVPEWRETHGTSAYSKEARAAREEARKPYNKLLGEVYKAYFDEIEKWLMKEMKSGTFHPCLSYVDKQGIDRTQTIHDELVLNRFKVKNITIFFPFKSEGFDIVGNGVHQYDLDQIKELEKKVKVTKVKSSTTETEKVQKYINKVGDNQKLCG